MLHVDKVAAGEQHGQKKKKALEDNGTGTSGLFAVMPRMQDGSGSYKVTAKVADFGLSVKMDQHETHVSHSYQGTRTHMAPELLLDGINSKASDV